MVRRADLGFLAAAVAATMTAVLGGGFSPAQRLVLGAVLVLVWLLAALDWQGGYERGEFLLVGFVVWATISAVWAGAAPLASKETITAWVVASALWMVSRRGDPQRVAMAAGILILGAVVVAGAVLIGAAATRSVRVGGVFENPNLAAAFIAPILPLGLTVLGRKPWLRWSWILLVVAAVVLTGSRAGLFALVVSVGVLLPRGRVRLAGVTAVAFVAVAALAWRFVSQPDLLAWHRISIWWTVIKIWATRPLTGVGPGCLVEAAGAERILHPDQVGRYQFVVSYSESTPLAIAVQVGAVGLILALLAAGSWWWSARRSGALESKALIAGSTSMITLGLFHDFLTVEPVLWWWAVVFGCSEAMSRAPVEGPSATALRSLRVVAALALTWVVAWGLLAPAAARLASSSGEVTTAEVKRTLRLEPWYPEPAVRRVRGLLAQGDAWSWTTAAEALHWVRRATDVHPGLARRWADLARVHLRVLTDLGGTDHDVEVARKALERACELDPHLPWHWLERARLERILGFRQDAAGFVRRALDEEPNTVRGWLMLSRLELERGRVDEARAALAQATERVGLISRPGLTNYERELLAAPTSQLQALERDLGEN